MNPEIIAAWIGIAGATVLGIVGWVIAGVANSRAKKANKIAEAANRISADALAQSAKSNRIAENANELSKQANTLSERTLLQSTEEGFVQWLPEWNPELTAITLVNTGRDMAFQPSVVVTGKELHHVEAGQDTAPGKQLLVPLPEIIEKRARVPVTGTGTIGGTRITARGRFVFPITIVVLWKTENGFQRDKVLEFEIREGESQRRAIVW